MTERTQWTGRNYESVSGTPIRRLRTPGAKNNLIVARLDCLVFVEAKYRKRFNPASLIGKSNIDA